jgi:hypothetical protein
MTPEVKQAIAEEVRRQLALENSEGATSHESLPDPGSSGLARMLSDHTAHVFVTADSLELPSTNGRCGISEGDVIQLSGPVASDAVTANLVVLASKGSDCRMGTTVTVGLADPREMQNHMRETIDHGLGELQSKQGKGGFRQRRQTQRSLRFPPNSQRSRLRPIQIHWRRTGSNEELANRDFDVRRLPTQSGSPERGLLKSRLGRIFYPSPSAAG